MTRPHRVLFACVVFGLALGVHDQTMRSHAQSLLADGTAEETIGQPVPYTIETIIEEDTSFDDIVRGASALWQDRDQPASGYGGLFATARSDYRRILNALYAEGRYGGSISIKINGREAADLRTGDPIADPVSVLITVDPGPAYVFSKAEIRNRAPLPSEPSDEVASPETQGFVSGAIARSGVILKAEALAVEAWRQQGHAKAEATERKTVALHERGLVEASIGITPGPKAFYGPTYVSGTNMLDPDFIVWMTDLPPGAQYDPDDVERANKRLTRLGVFSSLRIEEAERIGPKGDLPIGVFVQERKPRRIGVGASFDTIDGLGVEGYWLHRNLFGRAEQLRIDLRVGGITDSLDPGEFDYRLATTFIRPGVITPDTSQFVSFTAEREVLEAYTREALFAETGFEHRLSEEVSFRTALNGGVARFDDDVFGEREFAHLGLSGELTFDSRDDKYDPASGWYGRALLDPFYEFNYGNLVARGTAEWRGYLSGDAEDRLVLASRLKFGSLAGSEISETAPDKLFFAGGGGSVRGYAYRNIGVPVGGDNIVGGRSLIEGSAEVRARLTDTIGFAAFADAGYVDSDPFPDFDGDLKVGVGVGLRYFTSFAPLRLDIAFPLDPGPGDPSVAFYVGLGQAF